MDAHSACTAFAGNRRIASGPLSRVGMAVKTVYDDQPHLMLAIFEDDTGRPVELDLRGTPDELRQRLTAEPASRSEQIPAAGPRGPGRPRLGVVGREVTLLPRHWEWLSAQPGGASVTLRKLVERARRSGAREEARRAAREAAYRFMSAMAGNAPGFEEASRALFGEQRQRFEQETEVWPADVRDHARRLAAASFPPAAERESPSSSSGA